MSNNNELRESNELMGVLNDCKLHLSLNPRGTDKGDFKTYIKGFYENEFAARKYTRNRLLEIGVRSGASMALWANFFIDAELIGLDIEDVGTPAGPVKEYIDYPSVRFYCKDAYDPEFASSIEGKFTILIDDGPHSLSSQLIFIDLYLPKLDKDGVLIIEDIQGGYRDIFRLMNAMPMKGYKFEVYDFTLSGSYDDLLFVIRHNNDNANQLHQKIYIFTRCVLSYLGIPFKKMGRFINKVT